MVLGRLRPRRKRKRGTFSVDYLINVKQINPWLPTASQRCIDTVLLQWENGDKSSGSFVAGVTEGKIEFNESFTLPVTLVKESSRRSSYPESYRKNYLEFHLYESRKDKTTTKGHHLGSSMINLADYGIVEETVAVSSPLNLKKGSKNTMPPVLYVVIQRFNKGSCGSSPKGSKSKGLSMDMDGIDLLSDDNDEEEALTDDDGIHIQPIQSKMHHRKDSARDSREALNLEPPLHSRTATNLGDNIVAEFHQQKESIVAEPFKYPKGSEVQNRTESEKDSKKTVNMEPSVSSGAASSEHKSQNARAAVDNLDKNPSAESFKFQVNNVQNKTESARDGTNRAHEEPAQPSGAAFSEADKKPVPEPSEHQGNGSSSQSSVDSDSNGKIAEKRKNVADGNAGSQSNQNNVNESLASSKDESSIVPAERSMNNFSSSSESGIIKEDDTRSRRPKTRANSIDLPLPPNKKNMELLKKGQEEHGMDIKEHSSEDQGSSVLNDKSKHVKFPQLPSDSAKGNVPSRSNDIAEDIKRGSVAPTVTEVKGIENDFAGIKAELESKIEMLEEELREAAAVEVALYSVVAEHGNSVSKVHAPARRLSRFFFHACRRRSRSKWASACRTAISGLILVSRACGNDVPRLTFWLSNSIVLRATISQISADLSSSAESDSEKFSPRHHNSSRKKEKNYPNECSENWGNIQTFIAELEKVEAWIFSRIVESVWWQTLTPHMQSSAAKNSSSRKKKYAFGDPEQVNFSIDLWKSAFKDACERLCPLRAVGLECGCLTVLARLVMEQLVNRLDVAMFNAILRDPAEDMPTDPMSDPISDSNVLPVPAGKTSFGAGAQLKSCIGEWSRWLTDLFGIDDDPSEPAFEKRQESGASFKPFYLLNSLCDLLMLPFNMISDGPTREEVCPNFGTALVRTVFTVFVPDEFCSDSVPETVFQSLDAESIHNGTSAIVDAKCKIVGPTCCGIEFYSGATNFGCCHMQLLEVLPEGEYITSVPCNAAPIVYSPPRATSLASIIEVGNDSPSRGPVLRKSYTSDDELDELDSPRKSISIDNILANPSPSTLDTPRSEGLKALRYKLLREVWRDEN